jgi:tripartite-type tricarboxylate transporter receptor subunit TctC
MSRLIQAVIVTFLVIASDSALAQAASYPSRPIRIIVPSSPGGGLDFFARAVAQQMSSSWGQSVVIDNRAGAGGTIGPDLVAKAAPDGYTLLVVSASFAVNPSVYPKLPYDSVRDFSPIILATVQPQILVVHSSVAAKSVADLVALAKAKPGQLNYSSPGAGTLSHLAFELFNSAAGVNIVHIPYKGSGLSMTAIVGGETQTSMASSVTALPHIKSGRLRAIAATGERRTPALPDVLTLAEQGLPAATISGWFAFVGPARMPGEIVDKLNAEFTRILKMQQTRDLLAREGSEPAPGTPGQLGKHIAAEIARLGKIVSAAGARPQ